jgi:hypothetical protein
MVVSAWSWVRIDFWGLPVDRGVVHGHGLESLNFAVNGGVITIRKISKANQTQLHANHRGHQACFN